MRAIVVAMAVLAATTAAAHNRSEGRSSFIIDDTGKVDVLVAVDFLDVPELCNADLLVEPARLDDMRARLNACLGRDIPLLLRFTGDGRPCPAVFDKLEEKRVDDKGNGTLSIYANAQCADLPHVLVIDWGLFSGSSLDHVSIAKIQQPNDKPKLAMLSKRSPRITLELGRGYARFIAVGVGVAVALVLLAAGAVLARRLSGRRARTRG